MLVERAGMGAPGPSGKAGSITAFYTVLTEGDDPQDPIADAARAIDLAARAQPGWAALAAKERAAFKAQQVRAETGLGASKASGH